MRTDCNWANTDCRDSSRIHVHAIIRLHNSRSTPASRRGKSLWWAFGGGDGLSLSVGVGAVDPDLLGPGRRHDHAGRGAVDRDADGGPNVPRNAPTTFNVAFYDVVLFHDGRIESIGRLPGRNGAGSGIITPDSLFRSADPDAGAHPTGQRKVPIPYLAKTDDGVALSFEPLPAWMSGETSDGFPMVQAGIGLHGDMAVVNVAPGCEFFLHKHDGVSMRCKFCAYGAPDERTAHLGQVAGQVARPGQTLARMQETLKAAIDEGEIRHIYLVGGSLRDAHAEADRFMQVAAAVGEINATHIPVSLGSGALPEAALERFHDAGLVDHVCFNLEVWSEPLFAKVCPGKHRYVGYPQWIAALERAVQLWGRGNVYSAMVAGIELEPDYGMSADEAAKLAVQGAEDLCSRGILPIYSLVWPVGQAHHPDYRDPLRNYFETLNADYYDIRRQYDLQISDGFMCHRCAYMQLECDTDRAQVEPPGDGRSRESA